MSVADGDEIQLLLIGRKHLHRAIVKLTESLYFGVVAMDPVLALPHDIGLEVLRHEVGEVHRVVGHVIEALASHLMATGWVVRQGGWDGTQERHMTDHDCG